jgi:2-oxopent-4-enoate/cis-2-oxohex-4-enoate hydratase
VAPLTGRVPGITIDDAYRISQRMLERRLADGEKVIGKKIGVTSKPVQTMLGVFQPDFGFLTDKMLCQGTVDVGQMIQPRAEAEIAFRLKRDLSGPGVTPSEVLAATEYVSPCFEIVDSRIEAWKIGICDTIADNASSGMFVLGEEKVDPRRADFVTAGVVVHKNGELLSTGAAAAAMGSPLVCVAWLANTLGKYGIPLQAGDIVLSGSLVPLEPVVAGDQMVALIGGMGSVSVRFVEGS